MVGVAELDAVGGHVVVMIVALFHWMLDFAYWVTGLLPAGSSNSAYLIPTSWIAQAQADMTFIGAIVDLPALRFAATLLATYYIVTLPVKGAIWLFRLIKP